MVVRHDSADLKGATKIVAVPNTADIINLALPNIIQSPNSHHSTVM